MAGIKSVSYTTSACVSQASFWAEKLGLPLDDAALPRLEVTSSGLALRMEGCSSMQVDFQHVLKKYLQPETKRPAILRACGVESGMQVIDVTADWGQDAAILASSGADVQMFEHNLVLAALLEDGLQRLHDEASPVDSVNLTLHALDARHYLEALSLGSYPSVIYMDPLHLSRLTTEGIKDNVSVLKACFGADEDPLGLLEIARARVQERVVVKWPNRLKPLMKPVYVLQGKTVRFDVYLPSPN